ncbi:superoxide dismutase family protein [Nesterenkonia sp. Act20]|uniref:superoxide dismutase family protein n=1 Tax=Nesterenkonia sp. Act20 TaxID=1483432 RepID=UPI001C451625|nr:superoxide dismutase family protein [Nesterenkonia sp. Act20]
MSIPRVSSSSRRTVLPWTGIALIAALALSGCGDSAESEPAAQNEDDAAQVDEDAEQAGDEAGDDDGDAAADEEPFATAEMTDMAQNGIGTVSFTEREDGVLIEAEVHDLQSGFRGIAIHENGVCEPQSTSETGVVGDFESSGGHLVGNAEGDAGVVEGEEAPESTEPDLDDLSEEDPLQEPAPVDHPDHAGDLPNLLVNEDGTGWLSVVSDRLVPEDLLAAEGASVIVHAAADNHANVPERYNGYGPDQESLTSGDAGARVACGVVEEQ